jgi:hypothetical protein
MALANIVASNVPPRPVVDDQLARRAAPLTLAGERVLPVDGWLAALVPQGALVRGQLVGCPGRWGYSTALATVAAATRAGSWLAVIGVPEVGVEAAAEFGVELGRVVAVDLAADDAEGWVAAMGAAVDGFELVLTQVPRRVPAAAVRRIQARAQHRGAVVVTIGPSGELVSDVVVETLAVRWVGIGDGHGCVRAGGATVEVSGRRVPRVRRGERWWPVCPAVAGEDGVAPVASGAASAAAVALRPVG